MLHTPFPILTVFLIFLVTTFAYRANLEKKRREREAQFWAREEEAKTAPNRDLTDISYIKIPLDSFPIGLVDTDEAMLIEDELTSLSALPILNLSDMTNTDIRLAYGADNFDYMKSVGENFDRLEVLLCDYAKLLIENSRHAEAIPVLEFAVKENTTISSSFMLLGECYDETGRPDDIERLIAAVEARDLVMKASILDYLNGLRT